MSQSNASDDIFESNVSITIPQELFNLSENLVFTTYRTPVLFQVVPPEETYSNVSTPVETNSTVSNYNITADTMVLGFSLPNKNVTNLTNPVRITLQSIRAQQNKVTFKNISWKLIPIEREEEFDCINFVLAPTLSL